jgi:hypothetical protein
VRLAVDGEGVFGLPPRAAADPFRRNRCDATFPPVGTIEMSGGPSASSTTPEVRVGADPLRARLDELDEACRELEARSARLRRTAWRIRTELERGTPVSAIAAEGEGLAARREEREAWSRVNGALHSYRVTLVRRLVDDEGLTISEAARVTGNARQVVSRLYHGSATDSDVHRDDGPSTSDVPGPVR